MMKQLRLQKGFSLIELMIAVAVVAIITAVAVVSYRGSMLEANRGEAIKTLLAMQLEQEKYRTQNTTYGNLAQVWGGATSTENGLYNLGISNLSATTYTLTATAQGSQTEDAANGTSCTSLIITMSAGTETKTPAACWAN